LREYRYYEQRLNNEPQYRNQLIAEIKTRWADYNDRPLKEKEMSGKYIKHPMDVVSVGDTVKVKIIKIDYDKQKIGLTMKI